MPLARDIRTGITRVRMSGIWEARQGLFLGTGEADRKRIQKAKELVPDWGRVSMVPRGLRPDQAVERNQ